MKRVLVAALLLSAFLVAGRLWSGFNATGSGSGGAVAGNGDVNGDGERDISDAIYILSWLFNGGPEPKACGAEAGCLSPDCVLDKLDVADEFTAAIRAGDLWFGHSSRRGSPGIALADLGNDPDPLRTGLHINYDSAWPATVIWGVDLKFGDKSRLGHPGRAFSDLGNDPRLPGLHINYKADWPATVIWGMDLKFGGSPGRRSEPGRALSDLGNELHINFESDWATTVIGGNLVSVSTLQIRGGGDLAEPFGMSTPDIAKGSVVVIDPEHPGKLKLSEQAYDRRVAGIVSGANGINAGICMKQDGVIDGGENVALSGRVYALADASNGPIEPGDLLTTSAMPGHAMKVTDHTRAQGAILGKAMSSLKEGRGMVLVLVTLQ